MACASKMDRSERGNKREAVAGRRYPGGLFTSRAWNVSWWMFVSEISKARVKKY